MDEIRVVLGQMSAVLRDTLGALIAAEPDMVLLAPGEDADDVLALVDRVRPDVLVVQDEVPKPLARVAEAAPFCLFVVRAGGHAGTLLRIMASAEEVGSLSGRTLLEAVRSARCGKGH